MRGDRIPREKLQVFAQKLYPLTPAPLPRVQGKGETKRHQLSVNSSTYLRRLIFICAIAAYFLLAIGASDALASSVARASGASRGQVPQDRLGVCEPILSRAVIARMVRTVPPLEGTSGKPANSSTSRRCVSSGKSPVNADCIGPLASSPAFANCLPAAWRAL